MQDKLETSSEDTPELFTLISLGGKSSDIVLDKNQLDEFYSEIHGSEAAWRLEHAMISSMYIPGYDYLGAIESASKRLSDLRKRVQPIAIIFGRPHDELVKDGIIPNLTEWHYRSRDFIDLFCVGFQADDSDLIESLKKEFDVDLKSNLINSGEQFAKTLDSFEANTSWRYSGETDFLLLNAIFDMNYKKAILDFNNVLSITLERAIDKQIIDSVPQFIEQVLRFAKEYQGQDLPFAFSDLMGGRSFGFMLLNIFTGVLPEPFKSIVQNGKGGFQNTLAWHSKNFSKVGQDNINLLREVEDEEETLDPFQNKIEKAIDNVASSLLVEY